MTDTINISLQDLPEISPERLKELEAKEANDPAFIVKIQRALFPLGGPARIYNRTRSVDQMIPWQDVVSLFELMDDKVYHEAWFGKDDPDANVDDNELIIGAPVEDPGW